MKVFLILEEFVGLFVSILDLLKLAFYTRKTINKFRSFGFPFFIKYIPANLYETANILQLRARNYTK